MLNNIDPNLSAALASIITALGGVLIRWIEKSIMHKREKKMRDEIYFLKNKNGLSSEKGS